MNTSSSKVTNNFLRGFLYFALIAMALFYLLPLFVMIITSLKNLTEIKTGGLFNLPIDPDFEAWKEAWGGVCTGTNCSGLEPYFWVSVYITVPSVFIATLIGAFNGYALASWKFKGSELIFALILFGCFIPFQAILLPLARVLGWLDLSGTITGQVMIHVIYGLSFSTLFFRNFYVGIPKELILAAKMDGAGFYRIFFTILLPMSPSIFVVTIIWIFTNIWNDFLFGVSFSQSGTQPLTVALNNIVNSTTGVKAYNVDMASAIIVGLPTLIVYFVAGRYFIRGLTAGAVKG